MAKVAAPNLTYSDALLRLWRVVRTGSWCLACLPMHGEFAGPPPTCACPCHEAEALLRATGVLAAPSPEPPRPKERGHARAR